MFSRNFRYKIRFWRTGLYITDFLIHKYMQVIYM